MSSFDTPELRMAELNRVAMMSLLQKKSIESTVTIRPYGLVTGEPGKFWSHERAQNHLDFLMRLWWSGRGDDIINPDVSLGALGLKHVLDVGPSIALSLTRFARTSKTQDGSGNADQMGGLRHCSHPHVCVFHALGTMLILRYGVRGLIALPDLMDATVDWTKAHLLQLDLEPTVWRTTWQASMKSTMKRKRRSVRADGDGAEGDGADGDGDDGDGDGDGDADGDGDGDADGDGGDGDGDADGDGDGDGDGDADGDGDGDADGDDYGDGDYGDYGDDGDGDYGGGVIVTRGGEVTNGRSKNRRFLNRQSSRIVKLLASANTPISFQGDKKLSHLRGFAQTIMIENGGDHATFAKHSRWSAPGTDDIPDVYKKHYLSRLSTDIMLTMAGGRYGNKQSYLLPEAEVGIKIYADTEDDYASDMPGFDMSQEMKLVVTHLMGKELIDLHAETRRNWLHRGDLESKGRICSRSNACFTSVVLYTVIVFIQNVNAMLEWGGEGIWHELPYAYLARGNCPDEVADAVDKLREEALTARTLMMNTAFDEDGNGKVANQQIMNSLKRLQTMTQLGTNRLQDQQQKQMQKTEGLLKQANQLMTARFSDLGRIFAVAGASLSGVPVSVPVPVPVPVSPVRTLHASGTASAPTKRVEPLKRYDAMTQAQYCKALADEWGPPVELEGINEQSTPGTIYKTVLDRAHVLFPSRELPTADIKKAQTSLKDKKKRFWATYQLLWQQTPAAQRGGVVGRIVKYWERNGIQSVTAFSTHFDNKRMFDMKGSQLVSMFA